MTLLYILDILPGVVERYARGNVELVSLRMTFWAKFDFESAEATFATPYLPKPRHRADFAQDRHPRC